MNWGTYSDRLHGLLGNLSVRDDSGNELTASKGFSRWQEQTESNRDKNQTIFLIGNGASASMASHLAADLAKNAHIHSEVFTDLSLITAISNDIGYDQVFAEPLQRRGRPDNMLVAISSSGRSPNILAAINVAIDLKMYIVTLSAMAEDNPLRKSGHLNFYIEGNTYGEAETCHGAVLHYWMDNVAIKPHE